MDTNEIEQLFYKAIARRAVYNKLEGVTEDMVYNWRNGRGPKPGIGVMLGVLYQLDIIKVTEKTGMEKLLHSNGKPNSTAQKQ